MKYSLNTLRQTRLAKLAGLVIAGLLAFGPGAALADAGQFLKSLEGGWRGSGVAKLPGRETEERISCRVNNAYSNSSNELSVNGTCATTQFKSSVQGKLNHDGNDVTGALMGSFDGARMTKSTGTVKGNQLVVSANFVDNATGALWRSRQIVRTTGKGFSADFYTYENASGKYVKSGSIKFSSK
ncbi:MAG: hypothetical protein ACR2O0_01560 [Rhizobiaceae bacterium]